MESTSKKFSFSIFDLEGRRISRFQVNGFFMEAEDRPALIPTKEMDEALKDTILTEDYPAEALRFLPSPGGAWVSVLGKVFAEIRLDLPPDEELLAEFLAAGREFLKQEGLMPDYFHDVACDVPNEAVVAFADEAIDLVEYIWDSAEKCGEIWGFAKTLQENPVPPSQVHLDAITHHLVGATVVQSVHAPRELEELNQPRAYDLTPAELLTIWSLAHSLCQTWELPTKPTLQD